MARPSSHPLFRTSRSTGFTLTELMISLVLGLIVVLAATAMVVTSRATYRTQDEGTRVAESGRFALELVDRMVRLAGYTDFGDATTIPPAYVPSPAWTSTAAGAVLQQSGPNLVGADNVYMSGSLFPIASATTAASSSPGNSDLLAIRYYGSSVPGPGADGNVLDCAGAGVPAAPNSDATTNLNTRAFNVLFVMPDPTDNEPTLYCARYLYDAASGALNTSTSDKQALIRGVESFQVLYGEFQYAATVTDTDGIPPIGVVYRTGIGGANPVVDWNKVISVRIALLIRSNVGAQPDSSPVTYNLFGASYPGSNDPGTQFSTASMSVAERTRIRRVVQTTVFVRNRLSPWPSLQ